MSNRGIDVNLKNKAGLSPIHLATSISALDMVSLLIGYESVDVNTEKSFNITPLHTASILNNNFRIIDILAQRGNINAKNDKGITPLMIAVDEGRLQAVEKLLKNGADTDLKVQFVHCNLQNKLFQLFLQFLEYSGRLRTDHFGSNKLLVLLSVHSNF